MVYHRVIWSCYHNGVPQLYRVIIMVCHAVIRSYHNGIARLYEGYHNALPQLYRAIIMGYHTVIRGLLHRV